MVNRRLGSTHPDDMKGPGRADDFKGMLTNIEYIPFDFGGNSDKRGWHLGVRMSWDIDPGYAWTKNTETILAGSLEEFAPSNDPEGIEHVDVSQLVKGFSLSKEELEDYTGKYAVYLNWDQWDKNPANKDKSPPMDNRTNLAFFCRQAASADYNNFSPDITHFVGTYGHWNRLRMYKDNEKKVVLSLTELLKSSVPVKEVSVDVVADLVGLINTALEESEGGVLNKGKLFKVTMDAFEGDNLQEAHALTKSDKFLAKHWIHDVKAKTITAKEAAS